MTTLGNSMETGHGLHHPSGRLVDERTKFYRHLTAYVSVIAGLAVLNLTRNPEKLWFLWVAMGWGIGIAFHAFKVFYLSRRDVKNLE